ncbi:hypothetical protein BGX31_010126, partial [Mortierella sp. GBA43]
MDTSTSRLSSSIQAIIRHLSPGLHSLTLRGPVLPYILDELVNVVVESHGLTLEELVMSDCTLSRRSMVQILSKCPDLQILGWSSPLLLDRPRPLLEVPDVRWTCLGLRELYYTYGPHDEAATQLLHSQLGRLTKLEVLGIGCGSRHAPPRQMDKMLMNGWLAGLGDLQNLRHLFLMTNLWAETGQAEVEFMNNHWPRLEKISFGFEKEPLHGIVQQPHWQWLKEQRPWTRYT